MTVNHPITPWLCLCPLLAIAGSWQAALALAIGLLFCVIAATGATTMLRNSARGALRLPLAALVAGTIAVLEHLALAAWWPTLDPAVAPWLVLAAGLAVLVCCSDASRRDDLTLTPSPQGAGAHRARVGFFRDLKWGMVLSAALLIAGIVRDGLGRVFLIANTPVGALALLSLLLALLNTAMPGPSHQPSSPSGSTQEREQVL